MAPVIARATLYCTESSFLQDSSFYRFTELLQIQAFNDDSIWFDSKTKIDSNILCIVWSQWEWSDIAWQLILLFSKGRAKEKIKELSWFLYGLEKFILDKMLLDMGITRCFQLGIVGFLKQLYPKNPLRQFLWNSSRKSRICKFMPVHIL